MTSATERLGKARPGPERNVVETAPVVVLAEKSIARCAFAERVRAAGACAYAPEQLAPGCQVDLVIAIRLSRPRLTELRQQFAAASAWLTIDCCDLDDSAALEWLYQACGDMKEQSLAILIEAGLARGKQTHSSQVKFQFDREGSLAARDVLDAVREVAVLTDAGAVARHLVRACLALTAADRAFCWFYDAQQGWLYDGTNSGAPQLRADRGLVAFAARTGRVLSTDVVSQPCSFTGPADAASLSPTDQAVCQPVVAPDGVCHAVLVMVRAGGREHFSEREQAVLACLARLVGPSLEQLALRAEIDSLVEADGPFRLEALEAHQTGDHGHVIRISPTWVPRAYPVLCGFVLAGLAFLCMGRMSSYAEGPALIRAKNRVDVVSNVAGTVEVLKIRTGDYVERDQVIGRLYDELEANSLTDLHQQWETQLRHYLLEPGSDSVRQTLATLRSQRRSARDRLHSRLIRAPRAGWVGEVHARAGAPLAPGEVVASILDAAASHFSVVAFLPASYGPQIHVGMPLRVEISGYPYAYLDLIVSEFSEEATGAATVQRHLGPLLADAVMLPPTSVVVEADLESTSFTVDGDRYPFLEGTPARAEVRLRSEPILVALMPWLRSL